ncbi:hypothetical protein EP331_02105 [bacterium]|nr:MAG: hypothetical protein EP331_02105 [bacterium]
MTESQQSWIWSEDEKEFYIPFHVPGLEGRDLFLKTSFWRGAYIFLDGKKLKRSKKKIFKRLAYYKAIGNDDEPVEFAFKFHWVDHIPRLVYNGVETQLLPPLKWYDLSWAGIPVLFALSGGLIGGIIGGAALQINLRYFRSLKSKFAAYLLSFITSGLALLSIIYFSFHFLYYTNIGITMIQEASARKEYQSTIQQLSPDQQRVIHTYWKINRTENQQGDAFNDLTQMPMPVIVNFLGNNTYTEIDFGVPNPINGVWTINERGNFLLTDQFGTYELYIEAITDTSFIYVSSLYNNRVIASKAF